MKTLALALGLILACTAAVAYGRTPAEIDREQAHKSYLELDRIKHLVARDAKRMEHAKRVGDTAGEAKWKAEMDKHNAQARKQKRKVIADRRKADASEERERLARQSK